MPFKKGSSGNPQGRPKGQTFSINLREQISNYCEENLLYFLEEIKSMRTGHAKSQAFLTLLNYALPKLTESNSTIDFESLNPDQIENLLNKMIEDETKST